MEEIDFKYAAGKRVTSLLVYTNDGYLFTKKRAENGIVFYNCYTKSCKAKVQVQDGVCTRSTEESHSHSNHVELYEQFRREYQMKIRTQSNPDISIRDIVKGELGNEAAESPESPYRRLRSTLYHNRNKNLPLNPRTFPATTFYVQNAYLRKLLSDMSDAGIYNEIYSDEETVYIVLASTNVLEHLPDTRHAVITSSCRVVPPNSSFKVLLTISFIKMKEAFPSIFILMTDRNASTYERVFNRIQSKWNMDLTKAWIDYERNLRNAIKKTYANIEMKGFWHQYCIANRRKCKTFVNFFEHLWANPSSSVLFHQYLCLPLLPQNEIGTAFRYLKSKSAATGYEGFGQLNDFFDTVWMRREGAGNFAVEYEFFGEHCSVNENERLKKKWHSPDSTHSLVDLLKLLQKEIDDSNKRFTSEKVSKSFASRQNGFIRKQMDIFRVSETKDVPGFLCKLTFIDNNGSVKGWDNYTFGDEDEFALDDVYAYDGQVEHEEQVEHVDGDEGDEIPSNEACIVCLVNVKTIMLEPCNHLKFCRDCVDQLMIPRVDDNGVDIVPVCPLCRTVIDGSRVVYF